MQNRLKHAKSFSESSIFLRQTGALRFVCPIVLKEHFPQCSARKQILEIDDGNVGITSANSIAINLTPITHFLEV